MGGEEISRVKKTKGRVCMMRFILAVLMLCGLPQGELPVHASQNTTERVRVGFFSFDGYHMIDSRGNRSGYGYDYLQYLSRYTDFTYQYIGYDKSWDEMQDMLENGEIDLLTSAQKTEARMKRFDFSDQPIGTSEAILTVKAGNNRYMVDDYTQLDGIRIGMLEGNSRNGDMEQFAKENHFTYRPVYYKNDEALAEALKKGDDIDSVLTSNLRKIKDEWIIASFAATPFYIMVQKGNIELLDKINKAVDELQENHKELSSQLLERYYAADSGDAIAYTAKERSFISECQKSGRKIRVTLNSGREPVAYYVDGEARGIIPEIAGEILRRTGLPYEVVETPPNVDARQLLIKGEAEVRFDGGADFNVAEKYGFRVTTPYIELPVSVVTLKNFAGKPSSVGVLRNSDVVEDYVLQTYGETAITRYDSIAECLDAVLSGEEDAAFLQTYVAQRCVNNDVRNRLKEQLVPGYVLSFAVSVDKEEPVLFSILDKAVLSMSSEEINRIVLEQTSYLTHNMSLPGYLYSHPGLLVLLLGIVACFVIVLILYMNRRKNLQLEQERAKELERFITYVCKANNNVMEVDPATGMCLTYRVEEGKVLCRERKLDKDAFQIRGLYPEDAENVKKLTTKYRISQLMKEGGELYFECRVSMEEWEGQYQWFSFTLQGVTQDEKNAGSLMVFIKNIDQVKREEEGKKQALQDALAAAQQANDTRGTFLSRMSHEIRTPLNAIIGYITIAASNLNHPEKTGECLKKSEFAAHQLLSIINDVLDISAIENGKMKIAHEVFNIRQLLSGLTSIFHTQAEAKGVRFRIRLNGLSEENLIGDQFRLNQILMNLLSNAVKFTSAGGQVTLTIFQETVNEGRVYLQFKIADTGIGMSEEYKTRLFQPFEQQDASTAQKYGGTGLGLSITKNLVTMMNGTIDVRSKEGRGTLFIVNLSFDIEQVQQPGGGKLQDFSSLKVLVLYDENSDYHYMQTLLDRLGIQYDMVMNPEEAVRKIEQKKKRRENYDVCMIDWDYQDISGEDMAEQLRSAAAPYKPVLLGIAYEMPVSSSAHTLLADFILKPVFQSSLFVVLSNVCQFREAEDGPNVQDKDYGLKGMHILLAEDNELNMEIAKEILSGYGLIIDGARNGEEAAELFELSPAGTYEAILMDIQMPVLNGYEAAEKIRSCGHPQADNIPIIALTADAFAEDINRALLAGMNEHVSKPIDFDRLCTILSVYKAASNAGAKAASMELGKE